MTKASQTPPPDSEAFCKYEIQRMLKNSQTKLIMPVTAFALLRLHLESGKLVFSDSEICMAYGRVVQELKRVLGHDIHIGAKYYDSYPPRMSRYRVLNTIGHLKYELQHPYATYAQSLCDWLPGLIKQHIEDRLGVVPQLHDQTTRLQLAQNQDEFLELIRYQIDKTATNFEVFTFAIIKVHLEKFACKIYRDTRTSAHDKGVDLSTNFGVVYQVKKLRVFTELQAQRVYAELKLNFDNERLQDGNVVLVIDDLSKDVKNYLIDMKVQSISKADVLKMATSFDAPEDRQKVLRIVYEEFRREYSSSIP